MTEQEDSMRLRVRSAFRRGLATYEKEASIQRYMAQKLIRTIEDAAGSRRYGTIFEPGCGSGVLTRRLRRAFSCERLIVSDLLPDCAAFHGDFATTFLAGDIEKMRLPRADLIASNALLQWVKDRPTLFLRFRDALYENGILAFSTFAPGNLSEIVALTGVSLPYDSLETTRGRLETAGFEVLAASESAEQMLFDTPADVLRHLKKTGVTGVAPVERWGKTKFAAVCRDYTEKFSAASGRVTLTYRPQWFAARRLS